MLVSYLSGCTKYDSASTTNIVKAYFKYVISPEGQQAAARTPAPPADVEGDVADPARGDAIGWLLRRSGEPLRSSRGPARRRGACWSNLGTSNQRRPVLAGASAAARSGDRIFSSTATIAGATVLVILAGSTSPAIKGSPP